AVGPATAENQEYGSLGRVPCRDAVDRTGLCRHGGRPAGVDRLPGGLVGVGGHHRAVGTGVVAADREGALVVVLVAGEDQIDIAHWCMNTTIMSTAGSRRPSASVRSSHGVCRLGVPWLRSGTAALPAATIERSPVYPWL